MSDKTRCILLTSLLLASLVLLWLANNAASNVLFQ